MKLPSIGLWLWENLPSDVELQVLWDRGVRHLYWKIADGGMVWEDRIARINGIVAAGWGFQNHVWHYVYDLDDLGTAAWLAGRTDIPQNRYVLDMEGEWMGIDAMDVLAATEAISRTGYHELWCASFAFPTYHSSFPWTGLSLIYPMPQVFPGYGGAWGHPISELLDTIIKQYIDRGLLAGNLLNPCWEMYDKHTQGLDDGVWKAVLDWTLATGRDEMAVFRYDGILSEENQNLVNWRAIREWYEAHEEEDTAEEDQEPRPYEEEHPEPPSGRYSLLQARPHSRGLK